MLNFKNFISESFRYSALLPASRVLFNKNKVTIDEINKVWPEGKNTIQVAYHEGNPKKPRFIVGSGHTEHKDNEIIHAKHDQTFAHMGDHHVVNTIHVTDGKIVKSHKAVDRQMKAPVHVYK